MPQQRIYSHTTGVVITQTTLIPKAMEKKTLLLLAAFSVATMSEAQFRVKSNGSTSVISPNGTTIKNSFEVRQGAEFVIKPILP